jgi:phage-related protein
MGLFSWFKSLPGKIASGVKSVAGKVMDTAKSVAGKVSSGFDKVRDIAGQAMDTVGSIPVIGDIAKGIAATNPTISKIKDVFNTADGYVKMGNSILNPQVMNEVE